MGTGASFGSKCRAAGGAAGQGVLATCNNVVATVALDDDCLCGTIKADKTKFCFAAKNVQQAAAIAACASTDWSAASTAAPTYALSTITQAVTFSGLTAAQWTGALKTAGEIGYAKAQGWTTGTGAALAIATGYTVTSAAARRATTVTFTSTLRASPTAVTAATTAVTAANLNTEMTAVNTAKSLGATIPAASTITVASASSTTASTNVSGASTVTTSIMAMAVAVLAAFQARQ